MIFLLILFTNPKVAFAYSINFRTISGIAINYLDKNEIVTLAGAGVEYKLNISKLIFLSCEAGFPLYSSLFSDGNVTSIPAFGRFNFPILFLIFAPIFYFRCGLNISNYTTITLGLFYLWGIDLGLRRKILDNLSFDVGFNWMFDRLLLNDGLHDLHITFGFRYAF